MDFLKFMQICLVILGVIVNLVYSQDYFYDDNPAPLVLFRPRRHNLEEVNRVRRQGGGEGVTGPVHTFVKTDEHAHFKWGVRHHVGHQYAGR